MSTLSPHSPNDPSSGDIAYGPHNGLIISQEILENSGVQGRRNTTMINILSDNVLIEIFDQCRRDGHYIQSPFHVWKWHVLVHVCRRWRQIIFASPRRLDLQLLCTYGTPFRKIMGIWPTIPIVVLFRGVTGPTGDEDNVTVALEHPDRVSRINLFVNKPQLGKIAALLQEPFPVLTHLSVSSGFGNVSTLPDGFLGGSAPSLQQLDLCNVLYPALPMFLLSASNLVKLSLRDIPPTGYISPEAMVSHVAVSPKLETLYIEFSGFTSFPDLILSPPLTRTVLPALHKFSFSGGCKYSEDFVSRIDTPQLNSLVICYSWSRDISFDVPQLSKFINRSEGLKESPSRRCKVTVDEEQDFVDFCVGRTTSVEAERWDPKPGISVSLFEVDGQISHLTNILGCIFPIPSDMVHCTVEYVMRFMSESASSQASSSEQVNNRDDRDWLQLLRQLSSLQTLFVSNNIAGVISQALAYVNREMITEVLPALQLLCLEGLEEEDRPTPSVHNFLAVRQESGHPVTFVKTKEEFSKRLRSYP